MMRSMKMMGMLMITLSGVKRVFLGGTRTSSSFISPGQFEELALPEWEELVNYFIDKGVTPILHFDSDWTDFFPYLKNLPAGKCILNLDGTSDIFQAKEILGDRMCIVGDVPPALLTLGTPDEVHEYCTALIADIGPTGFILQSGCDIPTEAKLENVQAMVAATMGQ